MNFIDRNCQDDIEFSLGLIYFLFQDQHACILRIMGLIGIGRLEVRSGHQFAVLIFWTSEKGGKQSSKGEGQFVKPFLKSHENSRNCNFISRCLFQIAVSYDENRKTDVLSSPTCPSLLPRDIDFQDWSYSSWLQSEGIYHNFRSRY